MKFKEQRGNVFVFDGGYAGGELELRLSIFGGNSYVYETHRDLIIIDSEFNIDCERMPFKDIQTAVNLMQILIDEGLV